MFLLIFGILIKTEICAYTKNDFAQHSSCVVFPAERTKKAIWN